MGSIRVSGDFNFYTAQSIVSWTHLVVCLLLFSRSGIGVVSTGGFPSKHLGTNPSPNAGE